MISAIIGAGSIFAGLGFAKWATKKVASFFDEDAALEAAARERYEDWWGDVEAARADGWTNDEINDGYRSREE